MKHEMNHINLMDHIIDLYFKLNLMFFADA